MNGWLVFFLVLLGSPLMAWTFSGFHFFIRFLATHDAFPGVKKLTIASLICGPAAWALFAVMAVVFAVILVACVIVYPHVLVKKHMASLLKKGDA